VPSRRDNYSDGELLATSEVRSGHDRGELRGNSGFKREKRMEMIARVNASFSPSRGPVVDELMVDFLMSSLSQIVQIGCFAIFELRQGKARTGCK
jgi:hypothetical protein